jgi:hypothetical protein
MRTLFLSALAASALVFTVPASAQVHIDGRGPGVDVHVGGGKGHHQHGRGWGKGHWRHHNARGNCKQVRTTVRSEGRTVTRTRTVCR